MENVAPPLYYVSTICFGLENGTAFRPLLNEYLSENRDGPMSQLLVRLLSNIRIGRGIEDLIASENSSVNRSILELTYVGLKGEPVLGHFKELKFEIGWHCDQILEDHLRILPLKISMPVLLLQVPAYLILLFGPILLRLSMELNQ